MKNQEEILILDLYKHYKSVTEITVDEINLLYSKHGNIRNILKNLIQEFEPNTKVTEEYLDEKLKNYSIYEEEDTTIKANDQKNLSIQFNSKDKSNNKSFKKVFVIVIGILLISTIIWLLVDRQKIKNEVQQNTEINDKPSTNDEEIVNTSLQNSKYADESYEVENEENLTNVDNSSEINSPETSTQDYNKAVVIIPKTHFYETPSYEKKRKGFLLEGDTIDITNEENGFLYASFTNSNGKTTSGWIVKSDVEFIEEPK
jgi:hypothetical protein